MNLSTLPGLLVALALVGWRHTSDPSAADDPAEMRHPHDGDTPVAFGAAHGAVALDVAETCVPYATIGGEAVEGVLRRLQMPVLALFGGADTSIPADTVAAFERALDAAGVAHTVVTYPGAAHAFANPPGGRYDASAATDAWARTTAFLAAVLR